MSQGRLNGKAQAKRGHTDIDQPAAILRPMQAATLTNAAAQNGLNKLRPEDRAVHGWYRFVLSFPPHLVQDYLGRFGVDPSCTVLDPFCGTGTTLVECKKLGIASLGIESNPMAHFASAVKVDWSAECDKLSAYAEKVSSSAEKTLKRQGLGEYDGLPLFAVNGAKQPSLRSLPPPPNDPACS